MTSPFVVYTLHLAAPIGRARHYTGITRRDRLMKRMQEHGHGRGASLTAKAAARDIAMYLVDLIPADSPAQERTIKNRGHAALRCPICNPARAAGSSVSEPFRLPALPKQDWQAVSW